MDEEQCPTPPTPGYDYEPISPNTADLFDLSQEQELQVECVRHRWYCQPFLMVLKREDTRSTNEAEDAEMSEATPSSPDTIDGHDGNSSDPEEHNVAGSDSQANQQSSTNTSQEEHDNAANQIIIKKLQTIVQDQEDIIKQQQRLMEAQQKTICEHVGLILELGAATCMQQWYSAEKLELTMEKRNAVGDKCGCRGEV